MMRDAIPAGRGQRWAVVAPRSRRSLLMEICHGLERQGPVVQLVDEDVVPSSRFDAVVLGPKTAAWIEWAKDQQRRGALVMPDPCAIERIRDRVVTRTLLHRAGFIVPPGVRGTLHELRASLNRGELAFPVVVKKRHHHGGEVILAKSKAELLSQLRVADPSIELLIETVVPGSHFTAYFIGADIALFARDPFGTEETEKLEPTIPPELQSAVAQLQSVMGLAFGKLDLVSAPQCRHVIVDVGSFPKFLNMQGAGTLIAAVVLAAYQNRAASKVG